MIIKSLYNICSYSRVYTGVMAGNRHTSLRSLCSSVLFHYANNAADTCHTLTPRQIPRLHRLVPIPYHNPNKDAIIMGYFAFFLYYPYIP